MNRVPSFRARKARAPMRNCASGNDVARQNELARSCALRRGIDGIERLARGHEQAVTLGAAEADVATHLRQTDAAEQLALRRPHRHAAITHRTPGVARTPDVAVDIAAYAVRPAFHAVDHEIA